MNAETLLNAIGEIDDSLIADAYTKHRPRVVVRHFVVLVAALVMVMTLGVSALAAADVAVAYDLLYSLFPAYAQQLKPVRMSCVDNGIEMEVVSADVRGNEADVLISLRDLSTEKMNAWLPPLSFPSTMRIKPASIRNLSLMSLPPNLRDIKSMAGLSAVKAATPVIGRLPSNCKNTRACGRMRLLQMY